MKLKTLEQENLLSEGKTISEAQDILNPPGIQEIPWIAKLLLGAGGWLTAIFFGAFTGMLLHDIVGSNEEALAAFLGLFYLGLATFLTRLSDHPFLTQLTLAAGTAGLALTVFGFWDMGNDGLLSFAITLIICPVVYWLSRNSILKYITVVAVVLTWWIYQVSERHEMNSSLPLSIAVIITAVFLSDLFKTGFWRAALIGLISGMFFLLYLPMFPDRYINNWQSFDSLGLSATIALAFGAVIWKLVNPQITKTMVSVILFSVALFLIAWLGCAGIAASLGVIVAAHARNDLILKWVGILALVIFVIAFYYFLGTPLLSKSYLLLGTGLILIAGTTVLHFLSKSSPAQS